MQRRGFLGALVSAAAVTSGLAPRFAYSRECPPQLLNGVQLWSVRDLLAKDAFGTIEAIGELGFNSVELFGLGGVQASSAQIFGLEFDELLGVLNASGLSARHSHIVENWQDNDAVARVAEQLGIEVIILAAAEEFFDRQAVEFIPATSVDQVRNLADRLNIAGKRYRRHGITFGYHNHWTEFVPVENQVPLDILIAHTDPDNVQFELDIAWLTAAGVDPAAYLERNLDRVISCHLKDIDQQKKLPIPPSTDNYVDAALEPGAGTVDFAPIIGLLAEGGVPNAFVEVDRSDDPLAAIQRGRLHLQSLGVCV